MTQQALTYVELQLRTCALSFGQLPCTATLGPAGKCFNTRATCQDRPNFTETNPVLRFAKASDYRPQDIEAIASIADVSVTPARIKPGEDLGSRATLKVSFKEHPHSDTGPGLDPYYAERGYNPYEQGSFWSKFRARQPYLKGERIVLRQGFVGQTLDETEASLFIVESFDGPTIDGIYSVTAHDPLKMLDGDRAQCPKVSRGRLSADLDAVATSFSIIPADLGDAEYAASGWLNLGGKEMVSFTRVGDVFTIVRGQMNTDAAEHKAGDRVQQAARFDSMDPALIIQQLMQDFAGVPPDWVPIGDWLAETGGYLQRVFDATIAEPTAVSKLVGELMEQAGLSVWWDEIGWQLRLRVLRPIPTDADLFDERLMLNQSIGIREQPDRRYSEVMMYFGQVSPLGGDRIDNYSALSITSNLEAQDNYQSAKIKKIYSRWIARGGRTAADRVGRMVLSRYTDPPRLFTFGLHRGAQDTPVLGEGYRVGHRSLQDATGARAAEAVQIVSLRRGTTQFDVTAEGFSYDLGPDIGDRQVTINANMFGVSVRELHDDLYPDPQVGDTVTCVIEAQATVGGAPGLPALSIGDWPTRAGNVTRSNGSPVLSGLAVDTAELAVGIVVRGTGIQAGSRILSIDSPTQVTLDKNAVSTGTASATFYLVNIVVENRGGIIGMGGTGGIGAQETRGQHGQQGGAGGVGLYSRYPFVYRDVNGKTGGGGGGGAGGSCADFSDHRGGGGGGGAGWPPGSGGIGPGNGEEGKPGTIDAGGGGGRSYTSSTFWSSPELKGGIRGGDGGALGIAGNDDVGNYDIDGGSPGAAGAAIDGLSHLIQDGLAGTRTGAQIN